ncbi:hypothetical protein BDZ97DRAFT_1766047 [Flammula alnicola]|nr:hypothetical protein BDZ97DRAFT_1766047 [Flammula alnicola]
MAAPGDFDPALYMICPERILGGLQLANATPLFPRTWFVRVPTMASAIVVLSWVYLVQSNAAQYREEPAMARFTPYAFVALGDSGNNQATTLSRQSFAPHIVPALQVGLSSLPVQSGPSTTLFSVVPYGRTTAGPIKWEDTPLVDHVTRLRRLFPANSLRKLGMT